MSERDIVVVGTSAGGVSALSTMVDGLPPELPAAVFIVMHTGPTAPDLLPSILARVGRIKVPGARDGQPIERGRVYVAAPDRHIFLEEGVVRVAFGARENGHRPAVDPLFRSAARAYGPRVIGVILTGTLDCGTAGLLDVKRCGGLAVVQDPAEAPFPRMPQSALDNVPVDYCVPLAGIAKLLDRLTREPAVPARAASVNEVSTPEAQITCPACGGPLVRSEDGRVQTFHCKVGHRYSLEGMAAEKAVALEGALWLALRSAEDDVVIARRLVAHASAADRPLAASALDERVRDGERRVQLLRDALGVGPRSELAGGVLTTR